MSAQGRKFSPQFKAEAVAMVVESGRPVAEVARGLEIGEGTLGNWINAWRRAHPEPETPPGPAGRARLAELEEEVSRLRMENGSLKKNVNFFGTISVTSTANSPNSTRPATGHCGVPLPPFRTVDAGEPPPGLRDLRTPIATGYTVGSRRIGAGSSAKAGP